MRSITPEQRSGFTSRIQKVFDRALRIAEPMTVSEWADKYFYLSPESSYIEGDWETVPYQVAVLNSMGNDDIETVNLMKSSRVGYTKMLLATIGYMIENKKRNVILWQPTDKARDDFSKQHVDPMLRDVRTMRQLFPDIDKKTKANTMEYKLFANSRQLHLQGGKSAKNYREKTADVAIYDELSSFDSDIDHEGDPVSLGDIRIVGSAFAKSIRGSSPKEADTCLMSQAAGDSAEHFRRYYPCPHCDEKQVLKWGGPDAAFGIKYTDNDPDTAAYLCEFCQVLIFNDGLPEMDKKAVWISDNGMSTLDSIVFYSIDGKKVQAPRSLTWYIWAGFCAPGGHNWRKIVADFLTAKKDPIKLKTWVNTCLGEAWEEDDKDRVDADHLMNRREHYPEGKVPMNCLALVAGGDVQDDRIEISVWGFGLDDESWLIEHEIFYGDLGLPEIWKQVGQYLTTSTWEHESGASMRLKGGAIDSGGHFTQQVYKFCKKHANRKIYAIKGSNNVEAPLTSRPTRGNKQRVKLFSLGVTDGKDLVYGALKLSDPGPGYVHFPVAVGVDEEYFEQLTGERKRTVYKDGRPQRRYKSVRPRVEALDCYVYARAGFEILNIQMGPLAKELAGVPMPTTKKKTQKPRSQIPRQSGGWMDRYRP